MVITAQSGSIEKTTADAVVIGLAEKTKRLAGVAAAVDRATGKAVSSCVSSGDFSGEAEQVSVVYSKGRTKYKRVILVGLGPAKAIDSEAVRRAAVMAATAARGLKLKTLAVSILGAGSKGLDPEVAAQSIAEGLVLGNYVYNRYRTKKEERQHQVRKAVLIESDRASLSAVRAGAARGRVYGEGANFTRDLANTPSLDLTPRQMAEQAKSLADANAGIQVTVLDEKQIAKEKMGCFLGVAKGSDEPPRLLVLDYKPEGKPRGTICLVGKGITFDTGGISIKPAAGMDRMKYDMSGAAAVLGVFKALAKIKPDVRVVGITPTTENMPGGHAIKPGDVLIASNGRTVEVNNTDAEGRLVLADGIVYANRYKPDAIVDIATLTGAVIIALGGNATAVMGNDDELIERLTAAGERTGERLWQLPTWDSYKEVLKSEVADMKNSAGREAGTIAGAMFLQEFAGKNKWAHLDIAGTAWNEKEKPYAPVGSAGVGVRLLLDFIENWEG